MRAKGKQNGSRAYHVVEAGRGELRHHRLGEGVVRRLEQAEDDVVRPELPDVVEAELLRPDPNHSPEGDQHREEVRDDKLQRCTGQWRFVDMEPESCVYHFLRGDLPVSLNVPETKCAVDHRKRTRLSRLP